MKSEVIVTGCSGCPLVDADTDGERWAECNHPQGGYRDVKEFAIAGYDAGERKRPVGAPEWCPLRSGPVTVRLEDGAA